jgi:pre-mRNA cleavage complex 2 protein Pcf11
LHHQISSDLKLTVLYLVDSIVKNHSDPYKRLFSQNVVPIFAHVFKYSNKKSRAALFKLRATWNDVFWPSILVELDKAVNKQDPAWPIARPKSSNISQPTNIHINPAVFGKHSAVSVFSRDAGFVHGGEGEGHLMYPL